MPSSDLGTKIKISGRKLKRTNSDRTNNPITTSKQITSFSKLYYIQLQVPARTNFSDFSGYIYQNSAVARKGPFIEKQACGNKLMHSNNMRRKLSFILKTANLELSGKRSAMFQLHCSFSSAYCWVCHGKADITALQQLPIRPFFSTLHLLVLSYFRCLTDLEQHPRKASNNDVLYLLLCIHEHRTEISFRKVTESKHGGRFLPGEWRQMLQKEHKVEKSHFT